MTHPSSSLSRSVVFLEFLTHTQAFVDWSELGKLLGLANTHEGDGTFLLKLDGSLLCVAGEFENQELIFTLVAEMWAGMSFFLSLLLLPDACLLLLRCSCLSSLTCGSLRVRGGGCQSVGDEKDGFYVVRL